MSKPHNVVCAPDLKPDVWVIPHIVVIVLADEITQSPIHAAGRTETQSRVCIAVSPIYGL